MESEESRKLQNGQVSAPGESPKDVNQNTYTDQETSLAAKFQVEPKLVRLLDELIEEKLAAPEEVETQEQPKQPAEPCIDQQTQERLKSYYKSLDPRAKLAIATLSEIQCLDGINFQAREKEGKLFNEVWRDIETTCFETFEHEPEGASDIAPENIWLCGIWQAVRMVLQNC